MSAISDSLGHVRRLEQDGVDRVMAEARADAPGDFILADVATKGGIERLEARTDGRLQLPERRMTTELVATLVVAVGAIFTLERLLA